MAAVQDGARQKNGVQKNAPQKNGAAHASEWEDERKERIPSNLTPVSQLCVYRSLETTNLLHKKRKSCPQERPTWFQSSDTYTSFAMYNRHVRVRTLPPRLFCPPIFHSFSFSFSSFVLSSKIFWIFFYELLFTCSSRGRYFSFPFLRSRAPYLTL